MATQKNKKSKLQLEFDFVNARKKQASKVLQFSSLSKTQKCERDRVAFSRVIEHAKKLSW